jgi:hypothetical protein
MNKFVFLDLHQPNLQMSLSKVAEQTSRRREVPPASAIGSRTLSVNRDPLERKSNPAAPPPLGLPAFSLSMKKCKLRTKCFGRRNDIFLCNNNRPTRHPSVTHRLPNLDSIPLHSSSSTEQLRKPTVRSSKRTRNSSTNQRMKSPKDSHSSMSKSTASAAQKGRCSK